MSGTVTRSAIAVRSQTRVAYYDASLPSDLIEVLWDRPEELVAMGQPLQTKDERRTMVVRWGPQPYVLKHYVEPTWRDAVKHSFLPSQAWRTWSATHRLANGGILTPRPVACIEEPWGSLRRESFLMYPYVEGDTLRTFFSNVSHVRETSNVWQQLRAIWQRLAELRITLTDTNVRNFILSPTGKVWVIDLDRTLTHWSDFRTKYFHCLSWERLTRTAALYYAPKAA